jgi:hypothetical protein
MQSAGSQEDSAAKALTLRHALASMTCRWRRCDQTGRLDRIGSIAGATATSPSPPLRKLGREVRP